MTDSAEPQPVDTAYAARHSKQAVSYELEQVKSADITKQNISFDKAELEPKLHARTYTALAAFFLLNFVQIIALQGPASVLNYIGTDLGDNQQQTWIVVVLSLVQAVIGPLMSTASDTFQARKLLLCGSCTISFIGCCIAPGSKSITRIIVANTLIGIGFASVPLAYAVPSEITPRRWRALVQGSVNISALLASVVGPFMIGSLTQQNPHTGWRYYYWFEAGLWGVTTIALLVGYRPPKCHTRFDHLSIWQKIGKIDLIGCGLLASGLTLFMTGGSLGGGLYAWTDATVLAPLVLGIALLVAFGLYELKGTSTGLLNHDLFRGGRDKGRTFALCVALLFLEAFMIFGFNFFYPTLTQIVFTSDPLLIVARSQAAWIPALFAIGFWAYLSTRLRSIRELLFAGYFIFTIALIGLATIQPGDNVSAIAFACVLGIGFGAPVTLTVTGVQLSTPHALIATATACTTSSRAIASTIISAINVACVNTRLKKYLAAYVSKAVLAAGLPETSLMAFISALSTGSKTLGSIPGVNPAIIEAGVGAMKQAYADSIRIVFIIAAPFGVVACIACFFLGNLKETMNYIVDAPVEKLDAKQNQPKTAV